MRGSRVTDSHRARIGRVKKRQRQSVSPWLRQAPLPSGSRLSGWPIRCLVSLLFALPLCGPGIAHADPRAASINLSGVVAQAAQPAPTRLTPPPAASGTPAPAATSPVATISQPITLPAGTGMLLRLPQPAATVMSADPGVARVQPASPTSLFLMGVAPGPHHGDGDLRRWPAIVQYDVTVAPGVRRAAPARPPRPAATAPSVPAMALADPGGDRRAPCNRCIEPVRVQAVGPTLVLTGTVPTAAAAQQAEAIARGYVGDKGGVVDKLTGAQQHPGQRAGAHRGDQTARSPASLASTGRRWAAVRAGASAC